MHTRYRREHTKSILYYYSDHQVGSYSIRRYKQSKQTFKTNYVRWDGIAAVGEAEEPGAFDADTLDVDDAQPQQTMTTPELPPQAFVDQHRIDHWPSQVLVRSVQ